MSRPVFPDPYGNSGVKRPGARQHKAGLDVPRRVQNLEQGFVSHINNDTDELNLYRALGSSLLTYNFDPGWCGDATIHTGTLLDGYVFLYAMYLPVSTTVTGLAYYVQTAGVGTWTTAKVGLYNSSGTRVAISTNDTSLFKATGLIQKAFSSTASLDRGVYYAAIFLDNSTVTTAPKLASRNSFATTLANVLTASGYPRNGYITGQTDIPSSVTLSSTTQSQVSVWCGLY